MGSFYPLVARAMQGELETSTGALCGRRFLCHRRAFLDGARELAADEEAAGRKAPVDGAGYWRALWAGISRACSAERSGARAASRIFLRRARTRLGRRSLIPSVRARPWSPHAGVCLCGASLPELPGGKEIARIHVCVLSPGLGIHCRCPALLTTRDRPSKTATALLRPPKAFQIGPS